MDKDLHLILKRQWFEKIKSGEKTSEYRECKPYWNKRFAPIVNGEKKIWKNVIFHNGYTNETMKCELLSVAITNKKNDLNKNQVWELVLGKVSD